MCNSSGVMVAYNINSGVQFVTRPGMNPPPYSEMPHAPPFDRMLPPPPYTSTDNLAAAIPAQNSEDTHEPQSSSRQYEGEHELDTLEPLLSQLNNNGDINGNSVDELHVRPNHNITTSPATRLAEQAHEEVDSGEDSTGLSIENSGSISNTCEVV